MSRSWWWHDDSYCPGPTEYDEDEPVAFHGQDSLASDLTGIKPNVVTRQFDSLSGITTSSFRFDTEAWRRVSEENGFEENTIKIGCRLKLNDLDYGKIDSITVEHDPWFITVNTKMTDEELAEAQMMEASRWPPAPRWAMPQPMPPVTYSGIPTITTRGVAVPPGQSVRNKDGALIGYITTAIEPGADKALVMTSGFIMGADGKLHQTHNTVHTLFPLGEPE